MTDRVLASATVDALAPMQWEVRVWGQPPHDRERTYTIHAACDNSAAREGISRFVEEMENMQ